MKKGSISQNRIFFVLMFLVLVLNVFSISVLASGDVAYIYKNERRVDDNVVGVFEGMGLSVDLIDETTLNSVDFSDYKLLFLGDERYRYEEKIPVWDYPSIISNYYFGEEWGLTDADGISKLGSNTPLSVKNGGTIQVYTKATFDGSSISIPYYYLAEENKADDMNRVVGAYKGNGENLGDVISYSEAGARLTNGRTTSDKICFYGIIESDYWTSAAREMFEDCVGYVGVTCENDSECPNQNTGDPYCADNQVFQDVEEFECENPGTVRAECVDDVVSNLVKTCGSSCIDGDCVCLDNDSDGYDDCAIGDNNDDGKAKDCDDDDSGRYPGALEICDGIDNDCDGVVDEGASICGTGMICELGSCLNVICSTNSQCGTNGFIGNNYCSLLGDVVKDYETFTCNNPGTGSSSCSSVVNAQIVQTCGGGDVCLNAQCVNDCVDADSDNYDDCNLGEPDDDGKIKDCNDAVFLINPGRPEICDFVDNNCDGVIDDAPSCSVDLDGDGFDNTAPSSPGDDGRQRDCNDNDASIYPGAVEVCNGVDDDCDGIVDEGEGDCIGGSVCVMGTCEAITCDGEADCGVDGFINGVYCDGPTGDDVFQTYVDFTCVNPGTISSSCSQETEARLITDCVDTCSNGACISIGCNNNADCNDLNSYTKDTCNNPGQLTSYCTYDPIECLNVDDCDDSNDFTKDSCVNAGTILSNCVHEDIACFNSADCGINGFFDGLFCDGPTDDDVFQNYITWTCENSGTVSSSCTQTVTQELVTDCASTCDNGACVDIVCDNDADCDDGILGNIDICVNPGTVNSRCSHGNVECSSDAECGTNRFTGGLTCQTGDLFRDFIDYNCVNPGEEDSYCASDIDSIFVYSCTYTCSGGSCLRCNNNPDCDDSDVDTVDICRFGGTINSYCSHEYIVCSDTLDCGTNSFVGLLYCSGNNVVQNFRTFNCNNAGSSGSFCSDANTPQVIETCSFGCSAGACLSETQCQNGGDDDSDGLVDAQDPGCWNDLGDSGSYNPNLDDESRGSIVCSSNGDCGTNVYLGDAYCSIDNVVRDYKTFSCLFPGTGLSSCSESVNPEVIDDCILGQTCVNAVCVNECVDNDLDGYDNCAIGTPDDDGLPVDCNDNNAAIHPGATEICNGIDDDCDGMVDEGSNICGGGSVCLMGSCEVIECYEDGDCDDLNDFTLDRCDNPGTADSVCVHENIVCLENSDCGLDRFIGNPLCDGPSGTDVYQSFKVFTCLHPGEAIAQCVDQVDLILKEDCLTGETCESGSCVDVTCSNNAECGTNSLVGDLFCQSGDVYQNFRTFSCLFPGTGLSSCGSNDAAELVEDCLFGCSNRACILSTCVDGDSDGYDTCSVGDPGDDGLPVDCNDNNAAIHPGALEVCNGIDDDCDGVVDEGSNICGGGSVCLMGSCENIECYNDEDCDDLNDYTEDVCHNPGTTSSVCTNDPITCNYNTDCPVGFCKYVEGTCSGLGLCTELPEICATLFDPVCGCDGNTYSNDCVMQSFGISKLHDGECVSLCNDVDLDGYDTCNPGEPGDDGNPVDCNDNNTLVNPGATEICNGIDDDCDGMVDEGSNICGGGSVCLMGSCEDVTCDENSDCGTNGLVGDLFCQSGDVYRDYRTFSCLLPGTSASFCSNNDVAQLTEDCVFGCSNGACLTSTCVDGDSDGYDTCNPGQIGDDGLPVDCNDNNTLVNPGALEVCNGIDDDCDGVVDEGSNICGGGSMCCSGICVLYNPDILDIPYTEDRAFLQDQNVIDWNSNICYEGFDINGYCKGFALKYYDSGASATKICNMKGYSTGAITDSGYWSSPSDNTIAYWDGFGWKTQRGDVGGNRHIDTIRCSNPVNVCLSGITNWIPAWDVSCNTACSEIGMTAGANEFGQECTSGEVQIREAVEELGAGIFIEGCWNVVCGTEVRPDTTQTFPIGNYCYHPGEKQDSDATDITAACYCI